MPQGHPGYVELTQATRSSIGIISGAGFGGVYVAEGESLIEHRSYVSVADSGYKVLPTTATTTMIGGFGVSSFNMNDSSPRPIFNYIPPGGTPIPRGGDFHILEIDND